MPQSTINRRQSIKVLGASVGMALVPASSQAQPEQKTAQNGNFIHCLNMSTIMGHNLGFVKELEIASKAGFRSVEIWIRALQDYLSKGGSLAGARKILNDLGIKAENAIGFAPWIVDDAETRRKGLVQMKQEMEMLAEMGCMRVAAPPVGATENAGLNLDKAAERYRAILELGDQTGVVPHLELWGHSKNLHKLGEVLYVAAESRHPSAKMLLDIYHLYKGGSGYDALHTVGKQALEIFHVNDVPANISPEAIKDADRVHIGDGIAPVQKVLKALSSPDRPLIISFEVFNKEYYQQDPLEVAKTALAKMKAVTQGI